MNTDTLTTRLAGFGLFRNFDQQEIQEFTKVAASHEYKLGEIVLEQGKSSQNLWLVLEGKCEVIRDSDRPGSKPVALAEIAPGHHFGEMSFFHAAPHSASVRTKTAAHLLRIARADYDRLIGANCAAAYKLAYNTIGALAERLRNADDRISQLTAGKSEPLSEWSTFRGKVFDGWNL
jgi:CRP/FNR family transcriptional regulator, cyclic AMP receptor protein